MLPFDPKHLPPVQSPSLGVPSGPVENFLEALNVQRKVESQRAVPLALGQRFTKNLELARELSGEEFDFTPLLDEQWASVLEAQGRGESWEPGLRDFSSRSAARQFAEVEKQLRELNKRHPEIKTFEEIRQETIRELEAERGRQEGVYERGDWMGVLGALTGGMVGSFDPTTDPLNFVSLFVPGAGATAFRRILAEAAIGAGTEAGVQFGAVQERQRLLGIEPINPWASIALAGAGAAAFRGVAFEGAPAAFRAGERLVDPQRARAREFSSRMDEALRLPTDRPPTSAELLAAAKRVPQTPEVRAAQFAFELDEITLRDIGDTSPEGFRQWRVEVEDAVRTVEGVEPAQPRVQPETPANVVPENELLRRRAQKIMKKERALDSDREAAELFRDDVLAQLADEAAYHEQWAEKHKTLFEAGSPMLKGDPETQQRVIEHNKIMFDKHLRAADERKELIRKHTPDRPPPIEPPPSPPPPPATVLSFPRTVPESVTITPRPEPVEPHPPLASEIATGGRVKAVAEVEAVSVLEETRVEMAEAWFERVQVARGEGAVEGEAPTTEAATPTPEQTKELQPLFDAADEALEGDVARAVDEFVGHGPGSREKTGMATIGFMRADKIEFIARGTDTEGAANLEAAFSPVREELRKRFGDEITLYRSQSPVPESEGIRSGFPDRTRAALSWTSDRDVAEHFAGKQREIKVWSEEEIVELERIFNETGEVKIGRHTIKVDEELGVPALYGDDGFITDQTVRGHIEGENEWALERRAENAKKVEKVVEARIPLNDVLWATDRAGQMEFIVRNRPGMATYIDETGTVVRQPTAAEPRPTSIDIGTDRPIDLDQIIDLVDDNGLVVQRTVRQIMDDLADEEALTKAAKECLL